jgi:nitrite reductase/ring-hydroxylating ferredoxin subunit
MSEWVELLASTALPEGGRTVVHAQGRALAVARVGGVAYAIDNVCPHRNGELGLGDLQGHHLSCPLHAWCFDVRDGKAFFPQGVSVECFEVKEEAGRIFARRRQVPR